MKSRTRYAWVMPAASAMVLATASNIEPEEENSEPNVTRRPDTSRFHFASTFQGEDALRTGEWVLSEDPKYQGQDSRVRVERCNLEGGIFHDDFGLLLDESHKHYAVGATLPKPFDNTGKDFVMQYEVQVRDGAKCGGAYVKMLRGEAGKDLKALNNDTPYSVMFGPDKCFRDTNKVHFIFQHQNPTTKEWEEKHFKDAPKIKDDKGFHVYTLHVKADNTFDLYVDAKVTASGNLLEDFEPPVNPPKEIDDPKDEQPDDWVTEAKIPDPSAVKPDDWDDDAPMKIPDESAKMPKGWIEDAEAFIQDPSATKPDDWDDEEDGEWEPPVIANPVCEKSPGCGKWERPLKRNPDYKGEWKRPRIDNPDYVGPWTPRQIKNPDYFEDSQPSNMAPITGLAIEVWSVDGGVWFDNFVVGDDVGVALELAEATWRPKFLAYEAVAAEEKKKKDAKKDKKKKDRDAAKAPTKLLETSRFLMNQARPYLPSSVAPALDAAAESPIACLVTLLAGMLAVLVLAARSRRRPPRNPASASARASEPPAEKVAAKDDVDDVSGNDVADPTPLEVQQEQGAEKESEAEKVDGEAKKEDDPVGADETQHVEGTKDDDAEDGVDEEPAPVSSAK